MAEKSVPKHLSSDLWNLMIFLIVLINGLIIFLFLSFLVRYYYCCDSYKLNLWCSVINFNFPGMEGGTKKAY